MGEGLAIFVINIDEGYGVIYFAEGKEGDRKYGHFQERVFNFTTYANPVIRVYQYRDKVFIFNHIFYNVF